MKSAIVVDSTASLSEELKNHPDIYQIDLLVTYSDGEVIKDTTDAAVLKGFYERMTHEKELPTTSQPEPIHLYRVMEKIIEKDYDSVYCIHLSDKISGTFKTSRMITNEFRDAINVYMVDSKGTSFIIESMVKQALTMIEAGLEGEEIQRQLEWVADRAKIYVMFETLSNLVKGGRVSSISGFIGSALKIKPIVYFDKGEVKVFEKVRTTKRVIKRWQELVKEAVKDYPNGIEIVFAHGDAEEEILSIKEMIQDEFPDISFRVGYLTPVLGVHGGKGCKGIGIIPLAKSYSEVTKSGYQAQKAAVD